MRNIIPRNSVTQAMLKETLHYDEITGIFTWIVSSAHRIAIGDIAGFVDNRGYIIIGILNKKYFAHRLAWLYVNGSWPEKLLDHKNGIKSDNRIDNLRDVSQAMNIQNLRKPPKHNKSGYIGASWDKQRGLWQARIDVNGKLLSLGRFKDPKDAHDAYIAAKRKFHPGCTI